MDNGKFMRFMAIKSKKDLIDFRLQNDMGNNICPICQSKCLKKYCKICLERIKKC